MTIQKISFYGIFLTASLAIFSSKSFAQDKEILLEADPKNTTVAIVDTSHGGEKIDKIRVYSPRKAAIRSAILPGLGQAYNKKYWKIPIVWGALGTTASVFFYNLKWYRYSRYAYKAVVDTTPTVYPDVHPDLQFLVDRNDASTLSYLRDSYRKYIDYSALVFVLLWGLNVVDAAVDSHLKSFDVSPDLSLRINPGYSPMAGTSGISIVMLIGKKKPAMLPSRF